MAQIPVNRTPPCIQAQTIQIQDIVLSTGHIVLLTGQLPCSHGLPCQQGSTMSTGKYHVNRGVPCEQGSSMLTGASSCQHDVFACLHATVVFTGLILSTGIIGMSTGQCLSTGIICISTGLCHLLTSMVSCSQAKSVSTSGLTCKHMEIPR